MWDMEVTIRACIRLANSSPSFRLPQKPQKEGAMRLLIAEDNPILCELNQEWMNAWKFQYDAAQSKNAILGQGSCAKVGI